MQKILDRQIRDSPALVHVPRSRSPAEPQEVRLRKALRLMPAGIDVAALQRDLLARDQVTPILFQLESLTRTLRDTHTALGVDMYNGTRALYRAVKPTAAINGVQDIISRIGQRFAGQGRKKRVRRLRAWTPSNCKPLDGVSSPPNLGNRQYTAGDKWYSTGGLSVPPPRGVG